MLNNYDVTTYPKGEKYCFRLLLLMEGGAGASGQIYDSGHENGYSYASEEEAKKAGWDIIKHTILNILTLFIDKWPNGCTAQEWRNYPPTGFPAIIWDRLFLDLQQGGYIMEHANGYVITEEGENFRIQLKEIVGPS